MDEFANKVEKWTLDDGRRAERRVVDNTGANGEAERIIEVHVEDERPLRLQQRVVEKRKPFIYEREIQTIDKNGDVVEKKVESVEPRVQMQVVEHIGVQSQVAAQSAEEDCDCHVTKEEMIDTIVAALKAQSENNVVVNQSDKLQSLGLADELAKSNEGNGYDYTKIAIVAIIIAELVGLGYFIFGM